MRFIEKSAKWLERSLHGHGFTYKAWLFLLFWAWLPMTQVAGLIVPPYQLPEPSMICPEKQGQAHCKAKEIVERAKKLGNRYSAEMLAKDQLTILRLRDQTGAKDMEQDLASAGSILSQNMADGVISTAQINKAIHDYSPKFRRATGGAFDPFVETSEEQRKNALYLEMVFLFSVPFIFVFYLLHLAHRGILWSTLLTNWWDIILASFTCPIQILKLDQPRSRNSNLEAEFRARTGRYFGRLSDEEKSKIAQMSELPAYEIRIWLESLEVVNNHLSFLPYRLRVALAVLILLAVQLLVPLARFTLRSETAVVTSCVIMATHQIVASDQVMEKSNGKLTSDDGGGFCGWISELTGLCSGQVSWPYPNPPPPTTKDRQRRIDHVPLLGCLVCSIAF